MKKFKALAENISLSLKSAKFGKSYKIVGLDSRVSDKIKRRLLDLGFTTGQKVVSIRKSMLGKALLIELRGYTLSLRSSVAEMILIK